MPRSLACFYKVGLSVVPWPVDFQRSRGFRWVHLLPGPDGLSRSRAAIHEYVGWLGYWLAGYV